MNCIVLIKILDAWFDNELYLLSDKDQYGDMRYVGFHDGRTSEVVVNEERPDELTVYEFISGASALAAFHFEFCDGTGHSENLELIGMADSNHDFMFTLTRDPECCTIIKMIK